MIQFILIVRNKRKNAIINNEGIEHRFELSEEWCEAIRHYEDMGCRVDEYYVLSIGPVIEMSKEAD
jgi:hypothetical protein